VNFALRWPGHFTAMFNLAPQSGEGRLQVDNGGSAGEMAFQTLVGVSFNVRTKKPFQKETRYPLH
jgi:hypothetical protein